MNKTMEYFSKEIAYTTTQSSSKSKNAHKASVSHSTSESEAKRALMLPQELKQLGFNEEIIILSGENPIRCQKALYFNDRYFMDKLILYHQHYRKRLQPAHCRVNKT